MHSEDFIWQLVSRTLSGEASIEEISFLEDVLKKDESLQQQYEILKQFWRSSHPAIIPDAEENKKQITRMLEKAHSTGAFDGKPAKRKRLTRKNFFKILTGSAAAIIFFGLWWFFLSDNNSHDVLSQAPDKNLRQLVAQKGSRNRTILPDGSVVWLNAGSSLFYAGDFMSSTRQVYLKGEAFFDVVKQENRPFIVHANGIDIKVLGTAFDVKSYSEENTVEATLIRGLIQITRQGRKNQRPVYLHPNEKLIINLENNNIPGKIKEHANEPAIKLYQLDSTIKKEDLVETSWMYDRLEFRGDRFEELSKKLERWYNVKIIFEDEAAKHLSFNGSFENETVEQAFAALQSAVPFNFSIHEQEVTIRSISAN
jgi:ferric-dicitrate binding protein FerR (iron transport regulator)